MCGLLASAAALALSTGAVQANQWAASGYAEGGFAWLDSDGNRGVDYDISNIIVGGDFLIALNNGWSLQLGGAVNNHDYTTDDDDLRQINRTEAQANAIAFFRDQGAGLFGLEVGFHDTIIGLNNGTAQYVRIGGVAEFFVSDMMTIGGFGGVMVPFRNEGLASVDTGFYAGGHLTYYASDKFALSADARYLDAPGGGLRGTRLGVSSLRVGAEARYLTSLKGVQLYASAAYFDCSSPDENRGGEGAEIKVGVKVALGGQGGSLMALDRSNTVDTRTWSCIAPFQGFRVC